MKKFWSLALFFVFFQQCFADDMDPSLRMQLDDVNNVFQSIQSVVQPSTSSNYTGGQSNTSQNTLQTDADNVYKGVQSTIQSAGGVGDIDEQMRAARNREQAVRNGNWSDAEYWIRHQIKHERLMVNQASCCVQYSMILWNKRQRSQACNALRYAISIMDNDKDLGKNCSARAVRFLKKMERGDLPTTFTYQDIESSPGIHAYIMEIPRVVFNKKMQSQIARNEALIGVANAQLNCLKIRDRMEARKAKSYAKEEYRAATGKDFDPRYRPYNGSERDAWDSCKRIYDIWER